MQIKMNDTEVAALNKVLNACSTLKNLQHDPDFDYEGETNVDYHLEVRFTGLGTTFIVVVEEFGISKDITDYACW